MPWVVKECGRRGADGAGCWRFVPVSCVTGSSFVPAESAGSLISGLTDGLPELPVWRQCRARLVDRWVVWLGFWARPGSGSYALQFLPLHLSVSARCPLWLFRVGQV